MADPISDALSSAAGWVKDKAVGLAKDIAAKGTSYGTQPERPESRINMPKLAQDAADRSLGKSPLSSPMTPVSKKAGQ